MRTLARARLSFQARRSASMHYTRKTPCTKPIDLCSRRQEPIDQKSGATSSIVVDTTGNPSVLEEHAALTDDGKLTMPRFAHSPWSVA